MEEDMTEEIKNQLPFLMNGVGQIAIVVKDLDKTVRYYYEVFGIGPWQFYTYEKPLVKDMSYHGKPADHSNRLALSYFGTSRVELIEVNEGESVYLDHIKKHGYGSRPLSKPKMPGSKCCKTARVLDWMAMAIMPILTLRKNLG
jgi:hypothetical protein